MGDELLSCGLVRFPRTLAARVVYLRNGHACGGGFRKAFEPGNIDRKEWYPLDDEPSAELRPFRLWRWGDFGQQHAVPITADVIQRLQHEHEAVGIETRGNR